MKLTSASIRTITPVPPKTDIIEFDDTVPGFGVRARAGGSKVYVVQYAIGEKTRLAIADYQGRAGLPRDGRAGGRVLNALRSGRCAPCRTMVCSWAADPPWAGCCRRPR